MLWIQLINAICLAELLWHGPWVYFFFGFIVVGLLYTLRRFELARLKMKNQMRIARLESSALKELDQRKSQFFANISHQFRTPLTLIRGPLERLMEENRNSPDYKTYQQMHASASRLLELINQLLDLSKFESGIYVLKAGPGEIVGFIKGLAMSFASTAEQRRIELKFEICPERDLSDLECTFYYDADILEKIINNLLSNAFKYTPDNGTVCIKLDLVRRTNSKEFLEIAIQDSGIGISEEALPHIFDRFYQAENSERFSFDSSGIGLAYVHELVRIHYGEIEVESQVGSGSTFTVRFPTGKEHLLPEQIISVPSPMENVKVPKEKDLSGSGSGINIHSTVGSTNNPDPDSRPLVLIVEDHEEVRNYIRSCIENEYRVLLTSRAREGFSFAEEYVPDLIISDVMMPEMDGFRFCERIKTSNITSHIPIILLTARVDSDSRIEGLKKGADDYLTKPFHSRELQIRIRNLIANRLALRQRFTSNSIIKPGEISVSSNDEEFIEKLMNLVEMNMGNENFTVETMSREAGMSQSQLHRKLKAIVNMTSNHFIRSVRMHRAMELLQNGKGNISEVAYSVGYDDPGYFSKTFRNFFGRLPSDIQKIS